MKSLFAQFVDKQVVVMLEDGSSCSGKLTSAEDEWIVLDEGRAVRTKDVKEVRAEPVETAEIQIIMRVGRISFFSPESDSGHIIEHGTGQCWNFSGDIVRDALLTGKLLEGKSGMLVRFVPAVESVSAENVVEAGEVKPLSHHALRTRFRLLAFFYELCALIIFWLRSRRRSILATDRHCGFVCEFNRSRGMGRIREDKTNSVWAFYGNYVADKALFDLLYDGELGMRVSYLGHRRSSPEKEGAAYFLRGIGSRPRHAVPTVPENRLASGMVTAYYVERGFGFVKEAQSDQIWYFNRQSLLTDFQLQASLMRGEINQFVSFTGSSRPPSGRDYPAIDSMHGTQAVVSAVSANEEAPDSARRHSEENCLDAKRAEDHGNFSLAEDIYRKLLLNTKGPSRQMVIKGYAHLLNRLNRPDEAIDLIDGNKNLIDAKSRLGMLSIFYRKSGRFLEAADVLKQMALNIGLPKNDEKRISYLFQAAECFCEVKDCISARDMLSYLPSEFDRADPRYAKTMAKIAAAEETDPASSSSGGSAEVKKYGGFRYSELVNERLAACRYVGLPPNRLTEGGLGPSDIESVKSVLRSGGQISPATAAEYYLTMAKISDDIGESARHYLYKHFLFSAIDVACGVAANRPDASLDEVLCDVAQAMCCIDTNRFFLERLWFVAVWSFCDPMIMLPMDGLLHKFVPGSLIRLAVEKVLSNQEAADRMFQMLGIVRRNVPEWAFAFLLDALTAAGCTDVRDRISRGDRFLSVEGACSDLIELESIDERSLINVQSSLTSVGMLPSALDREFCTTFAEVLRMAAEYASRQSNFVKCTESYNQLLPMSKLLLEKIRLQPSILSVCLMKPAVSHLMELLDTNYTKHKTITPELRLELKCDDPESQTCEISDSAITLRFRVSSANEAAPPVHNLQFIVTDGSDGAPGRSEYVWPQEFTGASVDLVMPPFAVSEGEERAGEFTISVAASYDTLTGSHCERTYPFAVKLASASLAWEKILNPYAATASGSHVDSADMFFGREKLVADIGEVLSSPRGGQCFVLYGQKRSGKTSVLEAACRMLTQTEERCIISSLSAQLLVVKGSELPLFTRFAVMLYRSLKKAFDDHRISTSGFPSKSDIEKDPMDAVERLARVLRDEVLYWVVAIDEFTAIHQEDAAVVDSFMHNWKAMLQGRLFNALIVGQDTMPKFMDEHPNDFCVSHNIRLSYLTEAECCELASKPIELNGKTRYRENSLEKVYDWTLGSPYLVQKFCYRLVRRLNESRRTFVVDADIDAVAKSMYSGSCKMPWAEFDSFVTPGDLDWSDFKVETLVKVLTAVAKESRITGWVPVESIVHNCDTDFDGESVVDAVEDLVKRDALERVEGKLKIPVRLFAEWLRINM